MGMQRLIYQWGGLLLLGSASWVASNFLSTDLTRSFSAIPDRQREFFSPFGSACPKPAFCSMVKSFWPSSKPCYHEAIRATQREKASADWRQIAPLSRLQHTASHQILSVVLVSQILQCYRSPALSTKERGSASKPCWNPEHGLIREICKLSKQNWAWLLCRAPSPMQLPSHMLSSISSFASKIRRRCVSRFLLSRAC